MKYLPKYEIENETNEVVIFFPSVVQPHYPDGEPWIDEADAAAWAELYIASMVDANAPYPPNGPGKKGMPKLTPEQTAELETQNNDTVAE